MKILKDPHDDKPLPGQRHGIFILVWGFRIDGAI